LKSRNDFSIRQLSLDEMINFSDEIKLLYDQVFRKAPVRVIRPGLDYFLNLKTQFKDRFIFKGFFHENKMVAFTSGLHSESHFEAHYIGLDYALNRKFDLYQNILYSYIEDAIVVRASKLYFGRTALEIKSTVGARPHKLSCYILFSGKVLNTMARHITGSLGPGDWTPRSPFKTPAEFRV
jgi:hypothetical protein